MVTCSRILTKRKEHERNYPPSSYGLGPTCRVRIVRKPPHLVSRRNFPHGPCSPCYGPCRGGLPGSATAPGPGQSAIQGNLRRYTGGCRPLALPFLQATRGQLARPSAISRRCPRYRQRPRSALPRLVGGSGNVPFEGPAQGQLLAAIRANRAASRSRAAGGAGNGPCQNVATST